MTEWFDLAGAANADVPWRVRIGARPPFVRLEYDFEFAGNWRRYSFSLLAESVAGIERSEAMYGKGATEPDHFGLNIGVRDSYRTKSIDAEVLGYAFDTKDEADRFEHALLSALAHAGKWRRG